MINQLSRRPHMAEKIVLVDGLFGSGKALLSNIVSSFERVELLSTLYELEYYCILYSLNKLPIDVAKTMIRLQTDLKLYNTMMGRDVNFRPTDVSSAIKHHNPSRYFQRLFEPGDEKIPKIIKEERPILNIAVHNLLRYSKPVWEALGERCIYINIVRHPIHMVQQQSYQMQVCMKNDGVRDLTIFYDYKGRDIPYYAYKWEEKYIESNPTEKAIYYMNEMTRHSKESEKKIKEKYNAEILTVPFEPFVLDPESWIQNIANKIGTNITAATPKVMAEQNIPRNKTSASLVMDSYIRYGWTPPLDGVSEADELTAKRGNIANIVNKQALETLDNLSEEYEKNFWKP